MGHEYTLRFRSESAADVIRVLRTLPQVDTIDLIGGYEVVTLRAAGASGEMPSATVSVGEDGVVFVDYGAGAELLAVVERLLSSAFGPVTRDEL